MRINAAAASRVCGMMKLSVPSWSSSPHRSQFDKAGSAPSSASSLSIRPTGSAEAEGDQTTVASAAASDAQRPAAGDARARHIEFVLAGHAVSIVDPEWRCRQ